MTEQHKRLGPPRRSRRLDDAPFEESSIWFVVKLRILSSNILFLSGEWFRRIHFFSEKRRWVDLHRGKFIGLREVLMTAA